MLSAIDLQIFTAINSIASQNAILDFLGVFLANYLIWLLFFVVIILGLLPPKKNQEVISWRNALRVIFSALIAGSLAVIIGQIFSRTRPFNVSQVHLLIPRPLTNYSFPSFHAAMAFALACTLFLFSKKVGFWFLILACLIGIARVYVGVHYPSDIILGSVIGCASAFIIKKLTPVWKNRG